MRTALAPRAERMVAPLAVAIGSVLLAGIVALALDQPVPTLAALLVLCTAIAVIRFPNVAMMALLFVLPFHAAIFTALANRAHVSADPLIYWKDVLIGALFARAVAERVLKDRRLPIRNAGDNALLAYVFAFIVIALASPGRPTVGPALGRYIEGPLLLLTIRFLRPSRRELWQYVTAMLAAATVIGGAAVFEQLGPRLGFQHWYGATAGPDGAPFKLGTGGYRAGSFVYDPLVLGFYLAGATPFAVAVAAVRSRWRAAAVLCAVACAGGLVAAATRSGYIGGGVGALGALLLSVRNPRIRISLVGLLIVITGATVQHYVSKGSDTFVRPQSNASHADALTRDVKLLARQPFGYGLGTTDRYRFRAGAGPGQLGPTENTYLATALEAGVPGLLLYLVTIFIVGMRVRSARVRARRARDPAGIALAAAAVGSMVGVALSGMFLGVHELIVEVMFWAPPAIALAWRSRAGESASVAG